MLSSPVQSSNLSASPHDKLACHSVNTLFISISPLRRSIQFQSDRFYLFLRSDRDMSRSRTRTREEVEAAVVPVTVPGGRQLTKEEIETAVNLFFDFRLPDDHQSYESYDNCIPYEDPYDVVTYVTAAFRCSFGNQAYLFFNHEYLLLNYDPVALDGGVLVGPKPIRKGIPSLVGTSFASDGIYCAFGLHHRNEAFIFSGNECARISYGPDSSDFKILEGPTLIDIMFPCLIGTAFENHVDAAFESTTDNEAYLFRGIEYVVINYQDRCLVSDKQTFNCLKDTVFQSGIDAAFASHLTGEAFIFKDDSYALINFVDQLIIGEVKKFLPDGCPYLPDGCPSLNSVLPRKNICQQVDEDYEIYLVDDDEDEFGDFYNKKWDEDYGEPSYSRLV